MSVCGLLTSPKAGGLFARAIAQSGGPSARTMERSGGTVEWVLDRLRLSRPEQLRDVPVARLLGAQRALAAAGDPFATRPVVDGAVLPRHPLEAALSGGAEPVPLIIGTTRDEVRFFYAGTPLLAGLTGKVLHARLAAAIGADRATQVIKVYQEAGTAPAAPGDLLVRVETDRTIRGPALLFGLGHGGAHAYRFDFPAREADRGACHAIDIPFQFGNRGVPSMAGWIDWSPEAVELQRTVQTAWITWIHGERPVLPGVGPWPPYRAPRRETLVLDTPPRVLKAPDESLLSAWSPKELSV